MSEKNLFSCTTERHPDLGAVIYLRYADGDPAKNLEVGIVPNHGSNMFRLRAGEQDLIYCDTRALARFGCTGNFVMWPFPNRVRDKKYRWAGEQYDLQHVAVPGGGDSHLIHGLVRDRVWDWTEPELLMDYAAAVQTWVEIQPGMPYFYAYPFPSRLTLTYILSQHKLRIEYVLENLGPQKMPFGFGMHPLFSTLFSGEEETFVSLVADSVMEMGADLLPTGRLRPVTMFQDLFNLVEPRRAADLSLDHVYTGLSSDRRALIDHTRQRIRIRLSASQDFTHCVVYTRQREKFICVEHQTCSTDAVNLHEKGFVDEAHLIVLDPGKIHSGFLEYRIEHY